MYGGPLATGPANATAGAPPLLGRPGRAVTSLDEIRGGTEDDDLSGLHLVDEDGGAGHLAGRAELDFLRQALEVDRLVRVGDLLAGRVLPELLEHADHRVGSVVRLRRVGARVGVEHRLVGRREVRGLRVDGGVRARAAE